MDTRRKLAILADAARFDAPCARRLPGAPGESSVPDQGICHAIAADGRTVALLKVLLTNHCIHDCAYCVNRRSADVERARFTVTEIVRLTLDLFRQGVIEGLFLSSGVMRSADFTMEQLTDVARTLRRDHGFAGYIHLKAIPEASPELLTEAGKWVDRLSVNVELPTQRHLDAIAPGRRLVTITRAMDRIRDGIAEAHEAQRRSVRAPSFAPAGQVTQMVVGADDATDAQILGTSAALYERQRLRRVYYGSYVPIVGAGDAVPDAAPPAAREHRLYQADWLLRHYGFAVDELVPDDAPNLDLDLDPKLAWALRHRDAFPADLNRATRRELLRVPGLGRMAVERILTARRWRRLRTTDLLTLHVPVARVLPFVHAADPNPALRLLDAPDLRDRLVRPRDQLDLFAAAG
ncbi:DNA modification/repair radical SAM protein, putative [Gemmatirosa kalamazoonensis]|uniref:DNA modification/repair radical SAM protein, putative n=1 Tax=Gemmatirosa kalamazoonensis TaxID=861299 RepID=W0RN85_9BACT|nr:putative DNA modification/repair radical SAM protein [Gemmatirosa kalamazoonensis]AHG91775.1 DNA modification/repair radical SAM protein, putative [Gemmatirosa kalamazoonensis]